MARGVEGLEVVITALAAEPDAGQAMILSQTNNAPFLVGPASAGPSTAPSITLTGKPSFNESGTYTINWTAVDDSIPANTTTATTTLTILDLVPPTGIQAFYTGVSAGVPIANSTGVLGYVVWNASVSESDTTFWKGYRVRRTIHGVSSGTLEVVGQWLGAVTSTSVCLRERGPCNLQNFVFTGTGIFFKGFQHNALPGGGFVLDYPPGAPQDECSSCWVYVDLAALAGFRTDYTVTSIGPFDNTDYVETPLSDSPVVTITPGTPPPSNLERFAVVPNPYKESAEWDPAVGERRIHFIHVPGGSTVRIFTSNAELVRELTMNALSSPGGLTGELHWDLRNGEGRKVVSGIYIYQVETPEGRTRKGHFVIIK